MRDEAATAVKAAQERGDVTTGNEWANRLKNEFDNFKAFREGLPRDVLLSIHADRILESFSTEEDRSLKAKIMSIFGRKSAQTVRLIIPQDISDEDAMHALNARFKEMFPKKERAAIHESDIEEILKVDNGSGRRTSGPRTITLIGAVPGTEHLSRGAQYEVLQEKGLTFAHPVEQALAAAAYACRYNGEDLFKGFSVRCCLVRVMVETDRSLGIRMEIGHRREGSPVAASGIPLR